MPFDINKFKEKLDAARQNAKDKTDKELASEISGLTRLTDDEIQELFPQTADLEKLADLMAIVKSADDQNQKINKIVENSEKFAGVVITLLNKFI